MNEETTQISVDTILKEVILLIQNSEHEMAISVLEKARHKILDCAEIHYLLGAEYAETGQMDAAIEQMKHAVKLKPTMHTAIIQLVLAQLVNFDEAGAYDTLMLLTEDAPQEFICIKKALICLFENQLSEASLLLNQAIELNQTNEALNLDLTKLISNIKQASENESSVSDSLQDSTFEQFGTKPSDILQDYNSNIAAKTNNVHNNKSDKTKVKNKAQNKTDDGSANSALLSIYDNLN